MPKPLVLLYQFGWAQGLFLQDQDISGAEVTTNAGRLAAAHVVVFHIPTAPHNLAEITKYPGQMWVAFSLESDVNYPQQSNLEFMQRFDLTMTYRLDSDLPATYMGPCDAGSLLGAPAEKTALAPAVYFSSNALDRCGREDYVRSLMRYLPVDSYGASLNNKKLAEDSGRASKLAAIGRYKFSLAFENSIAEDYVTEKFFDALIAGAVPVYRGAPNVARFAPDPRCFIDVSRFSGSRELAEYLIYLDKEEAEYAAYFDWKLRPLDPNFVAMARRYSICPLQRLAEKLHFEDGVLKSAHEQRDPIHQAIRWLKSGISLKANASQRYQSKS